MKNYICYENNGKIIKVGVCDDYSFNLQLPNVIEGVACDESQYVENNQIVNMPPKPNAEAYFDYESKQWVLDKIAQNAVIMSKRASLLSKSDWTQLPDVPLETKQSWATYRQALRDITTQEGYPFNVIWPTKPE